MGIRDACCIEEVLVVEHDIDLLLGRNGIELAVCLVDEVGAPDLVGILDVL